MTSMDTARLSAVSVHMVGNKANGGELVTSKTMLSIDEDTAIKLKNAFLGKFSYDLEKYAFHHPSSLNYNEVYNYCLEILADEHVFHKYSVDIARHLFDSTNHPRIKPGDLYVCLFDGCLYEGATVQAVGLFKTETKSSFADVQAHRNDVAFAMREGVDITKFDKACLVFPVNAENGFDVLIYDNRNRGEEAIFWREGFLGVQPQATEFAQTNQFLGMAKQYIAEQLPGEYEVSKTDQIDLLNKSVEYFRANEHFDKKQFVKQVFDDPGMARSFNRFEADYADENALDMPDSFGISTQAVKKQARVFKSVLKLDKNFHVYIHGDKSLIEKGYDAATGRKFYKIYFEEEE